MPGRKYSTGNGYRYGFNGQEHSTELNDNSYTAEFWEYDSRLGRRWNIDPKPNTPESPYLTFGGNPILFNDRNGDTPRVQMNNTFYSLVRGKDKNLQYVDSKGAAYTGTLSSNAATVLTAFTNGLKGGGSNTTGSTLQGRANEILNSKFDLFITEDQAPLTGEHGTGGNELYAYKMADGGVQQAFGNQPQPKNTVGAYISLTGSSMETILDNKGMLDRTDKAGPILPVINGPSVLVAVHEIFGHGWQATKKLLSGTRIPVGPNAALGFPKAVENDAQTMVNLYAIHNGLNQFVQRYYRETGTADNDPDKVVHYVHKLVWGFMLGTQTSNGLQNFPEPK